MIGFVSLFLAVTSNILTFETADVQDREKIVAEFENFKEKLDRKIEQQSKFTSFHPSKQIVSACLNHLVAYVSQP
jgi:molecular chaperone GrpE (heat shock protein)